MVCNVMNPSQRSMSTCGIIHIFKKFRRINLSNFCGWMGCPPDALFRTSVHLLKPAQYPYPVPVCSNGNRGSHPSFPLELSNGNRGSHLLFPVEFCSVPKRQKCSETVPNVTFIYLERLPSIARNRNRNAEIGTLELKKRKPRCTRFVLSR